MKELYLVQAPVISSRAGGELQRTISRLVRTDKGSYEATQILERHIQSHKLLHDTEHLGLVEAHEVIEG